MSRDPYSWAAQFGNDQQQRASTAENGYQNALMQAFQEEALRQRPAAMMPTQLAQNELERRNQQPYTNAANDLEQRRWYERQDYDQQQQLALIQARADAKQQQGGDTTDGDIAQPDGSIFHYKNGVLLSISPPQR